MAPVLGYWDLRGLTSPIRYLLHYKNVEFEDKRYTSREGWLEEKSNLGLDFPNLPYLMDGDIRLTQSLAILRHLARKHDMSGANETEKYKIEMVEQQITDLRMGLIWTCISADFEERKKEYVKNLPNVMKLWSEYLGDKKFLIGDNLTYVDFIAYDALDFHEMLHPSVYAEFPKLKAYMRRIEAIPQIKRYQNSADYKRWPIFGPIAKFGGGGEEPKKVL